MRYIVIFGKFVATMLKAIFGTDKPQAKTVRHAEQEIKTHDGKTDSARLRDLGL